MPLPRTLRSTRILKALPFLSSLCVIVGVAWLLLLPLDDYSRKTYISENALLPGQVHTYFGGSEQNVFRAYRNEVTALGTNASAEGRMSENIADIFKAQGLKVGRQRYRYTAAGNIYEGENVYAILQAPRGDATEAIVLCAGWVNTEGQLNESGVALVLSLARYLKRWSLWSKDIIFLITSDSRAGPQAWVDAYHDLHSPPSVSPLPLKSGAIQGVIVVDYPTSSRFESLHIVYDGINGQLPNLDLINTAVQIASAQMGIRTTLQEMWKHDDKYEDRLRTMLRGMVNQGLGHASGPHSSFIPYHIDAITLQAYGEGWHDEVTLGRSVESLFRSLNNLLEHFHQSFFFYLLMAPRRFVSIGTYLPSAMLIAGNFTIAAIGLWIQSGRKNGAEKKSVEQVKDDSEKESLLGKEVEGTAVVKETKTQAGQSIKQVEDERKLFLPLTFVIAVHFLGFMPLYLFNNLDETHFTTAFFGFSAFSAIFPPLLSLFISKTFSPTATHFTLIKCFSLLILGLFLSSLATLNFSLSFLVGLFSVPFTFVRPFFPEGKWILGVSYMILLQILGPTAALVGVACYWGEDISIILKEASFGWNVWGMWTQVVVWCVWWPAWVTANAMVAATWKKDKEGKKLQAKEDMP
ncbi:Glycosyl phosphatidyl inositol protein transamidase complex subunit [Rhizina undulata]